MVLCNTSGAGRLLWLILTTVEVEKNLDRNIHEKREEESEYRGPFNCHSDVTPGESGPKIKSKIVNNYCTLLPLHYITIQYNI